MSNHRKTKVELNNDEETTIYSQWGNGSFTINGFIIIPPDEVVNIAKDLCKGTAFTVINEKQLSVPEVNTSVIESIEQLQNDIKEIKSILTPV